MEQRDVQAAAEAVRRALAASAAWAPALENATVTNQWQVATREGKSGPFHLVECARGGRVTARFALADDGTLLEAEGARRADAGLAPLAPPPPPSPGGPSPVLIWQPCDQSTTRLRPFWHYTRDGKEQFARVDGTTFDRLTITQG